MKSLIINKKNGFTLVETLIATMIMVIALGTISYSLSRFINITKTITDIDIALHAAQAKLEVIANSDISRIMINYNNQSFNVIYEMVDKDNNVILDKDGNPKTIELLPHADKSSVGLVEVTPISGTNLFDVVITMSWLDGFNGRKIEKKIETTFISK